MHKHKNSRHGLTQVIKKKGMIEREKDAVPFQTWGLASWEWQAARWFYPYAASPPGCGSWKLLQSSHLIYPLLPSFQRVKTMKGIHGIGMRQKHEEVAAMEVQVLHHIECNQPLEPNQNKGNSPCPTNNLSHIQLQIYLLFITHTRLLFLHY